jgi:hypothetical protein
MKKNISQSSTFGLIAANKFINSVNRGAVGLEADMQVFGPLGFYGQFSLSYGDYKEDNIAFMVSPRFDSENFHLHLTYTQIGRNFRENANNVGYIPDDNRKEWDLYLLKTFPFKKAGFNAIQYESKYNIFWGIDGILRSWQIDQAINLFFHDFWKVSALHIQEYKLNDLYPDNLDMEEDILLDTWNEFFLTVDKSHYHNPEYIFHLLNPTTGSYYYIYLGEKEYRNYRTILSSGFDKKDKNAFYMGFTFGKHFADTYTMFRLMKEATVGRSLFINYNLERWYFKRATHPAYVNTWIQSLSLSSTFSEKYLGRLFFQQCSGLKKINFQLQFIYYLLPPSGSIQLVFQKGLTRFGEEGSEGSAFFVKVAYTF